MNQNPANQDLSNMLTFLDVEIEELLNPQYEGSEHFYLALTTDDLPHIKAHQLRSLKSRHPTKPLLIYISNPGTNQYSMLSLIDALIEIETTGILSSLNLGFYDVAW